VYLLAPFLLQPEVHPDHERFLELNAEVLDIARHEHCPPDRIGGCVKLI